MADLIQLIVLEAILTKNKHGALFGICHHVMRVERRMVRNDVLCDFSIKLKLSYEALLVPKPDY